MITVFGSTNLDQIGTVSRLPERVTPSVAISRPGSIAAMTSRPPSGAPLWQAAWPV
jgi:hypothetical protein